MLERKIIRLKKIPSHDMLLELMELMVYLKLSYPVGAKDDCTVIVDVKNARIITPDTTYIMGDDLFIELYLLSNKVIANLYKTIEDDKSVYINCISDDNIYCLE